MTTQLNKAFLLIKDAAGEREILLETERSYIVGRSPNADIQLSDQKASREHAVIRLVKTTLQVTDSGSRNGTFARGSRLSEVCLGFGESFTIGSCRLSFLCSNPKSSDIKLGNKKAVPRPRLSLLALSSIVVFFVCIIYIAFLAVKNTSTQKDQGQLFIEMEPTSVIEKSVVKSPQATDTMTREVNLEKAKEHYRLGLLFYDSGHLKKAIDHWDLALVFDPSNELVLKKINKAMLDLEDKINLHYQGAKTHYQYMRFHEAGQEFMIVKELIKDKNDERYLDAVEKLLKLKDEK